MRAIVCVNSSVVINALVNSRYNYNILFHSKWSKRPELVIRGKEAHIIVINEITSFTYKRLKKILKNYNKSVFLYETYNANRYLRNLFNVTTHKQSLDDFTRNERMHSVLKSVMINHIR